MAQMGDNSTCIIQPSAASSVALPIIYTILCIIGILGNTLSQWVFFRKIGRRTSTHIYLTHLVTANLLVCSAMPFMCSYFREGSKWTYQSLPCKVVICFGTLSMHVSMFVSLTIFTWIAISRYATLMKHDPTQEKASLYEKIFFGRILKKFRQPNFAKKLCIYIWVTVLGVIAPIIIYYSIAEAKVFTESPEVEKCYNQKTEFGEHTSQTASHVGTAFVGFSLLVVVLSYSSFVSYLRKIGTRTAIMERCRIYSSVKRHILVIQILLIVCFLPHGIFRPIFYALHKKDCQELTYLVEIKNFFTCLAAARSSTDPFIFLLLDKTFKKSLSALFKKSPEPYSSKTSPKHTADLCTENTTEMEK
ncbi:probable G-protein coupled receptor 82 [Tachyglossus aculeatus]|uniref:probable G-protein coupled receptor 82 n=1 Tax=Tachyglossus aculeatus TaxID=9261 RepID=UPI0018F5E3DB|nr:probable G-protein coupled receptor 82 [Tachyglossus aculeatus]